MRARDDFILVEDVARHSETDEEYAAFHDIYDFGPEDDDTDAPFYGIDDEF